MVSQQDDFAVRSFAGREKYGRPEFRVTWQNGVTMLDHISIAVSDLSRAIGFYDAVLQTLGYVRVWTVDDAAGYARPGETDEPFALKEQRESVATNERFHVAFKAPSREAASAFHAVAMALEATDNGGVGLHIEYGSNYYAAFVIDLDGNRIEAVHHG